MFRKRCLIYFSRTIFSFSNSSDVDATQCICLQLETPPSAREYNPLTKYHAAWKIHSEGESLRGGRKRDSPTGHCWATTAGPRPGGSSSFIKEWKNLVEARHNTSHWMDLYIMHDEVWKQSFFLCHRWYLWFVSHQFYQFYNYLE